MPSSPSRKAAKLLLLTAVTTAMLPCVYAQKAAHKTRPADNVDALLAAFRNPPDNAKPMVRWWWFGPAVTKPEILRELQQMKADGIGGAELAFVYAEELDDPARGIKNLRWLSPEHLDAIRYAQAQGRRLGLRIDITLCSGWPYGGPATTIQEAATRLLTREVAVPAGARSIEKPKLGEGESFISVSLVRGAPKQWDATTAKPLALGTGASVSVEAANEPRTALFFVLGHTKQQVKRAAVGAEGYVLDPFSKQAVATHLKAVGEPMLKAFGATPPYAIFSDSLEAYGADWTPSLPAEFKKRRGYDMLPLLPALVQGGTPEAEKVRHDWGKTLTELVNEAYLVQINNWARAHHTKFRSQTYGEPAVSLSSQKLVDLPEGEGPQWRAFSTLRWATSANHIFGNNVTSGETFTWLHSPVFRATPLDMKAEADIDFITGENQLVFHGWPYSPPDTDIKPGWSLYAAANFNDNNPWHPVMPVVDKYIQRMSWLLRQGQPANQVAVLLPTDDAWASFFPGKVSVTAAMQTLLPKEMLAAILSSGYNYDYIDADAINTTGLGTHQVLVIPPTKRMPLSTLARLKEWQSRGGKVIMMGASPMYDAEGNMLSAEQTKMLSVVPSVASLPTALHDAAPPDLLMQDDGTARDQLGFIHRRLANADIYFVANTGNTAVDVRLAMASKHMRGVRLDPETGAAMTYDAHSRLALAPYGSAAFLFADGAPAPAEPVRTTETLATLDRDWSVTFQGIGKTEAFPRLVDWTDSSATVHYSGEATYTKHFHLDAAPKSPVWLAVEGGKALAYAPNITLDRPALGKDGLPNPQVTRTGPGMRAYYEPPVREAALVTINGHPAGALWHPPYRLDITKLVKPGENTIEIHVYNTAMNAWSALPPHDYKPLIAKYGDKFQVQDLDKVKPEPSGLVGKVVLLEEK